MAIPNNYQELIHNQQILRNRLHNLLVVRPLSMVKLAKEVSTSPLTMRNFFIRNKDVTYETIYKIATYVINKEQELGLRRF